MSKESVKAVEKKIHEAICYRMVSYFGNQEMAHQWGYLPGSLGYRETKKSFAKQFDLIKYEDFCEDLFVAFMYNLKVREKKKSTMREVLKTEGRNEEYRPIYTKLNAHYKEFADKTRFDDISKEFILKKDNITDALNTIDEIGDKVWDYSKQEALFNSKRINIGPAMLRLELNEIYKILTSVNQIEEVGKEILISKEKKRDELEKLCNIDHESNFYEVSVKDRMQYIQDKTFTQGNLNSIDKEKLNVLFEERLYSIGCKKSKENSRARTKETLLEKVLNGTIGSISNKSFMEQFFQLPEWYKGVGSGESNLDEVISFYDVESEMNLGIYFNIAYELVVYYGRIPKSAQKTLVEKVAKLALLDNCLTRQRLEQSIDTEIEKIKVWDSEEKICKVKEEEYTDKQIGLTILVSEICEEHLQGGDALFKKYKKQMEKLLELKYTILNNMPQHYEYTDKAYSYIGEEAKKNIKRTIKDLYDIQNKQVFNYLKMLLEENNKVIEERTQQILKVK